MTSFRKHSADNRSWPVNPATRRRLYELLAALAIGAITCPCALAADAATPPPPSGWSFGLFGAEALNNSLGEVIPKALGGDLDFKPAHLAGLMARHALPVPDWFASFGRWADMPVGTSIEVDLLKGSGLVHNSEFAVDWRPAIRPGQIGPLTLEFAWGFGYSHSFGKPWTDYTDRQRPGGYHDLFHMAPEIVFIPTQAPDWSLGLRIHHRSGIYGLVAPKKVGSNHLALTLAHSF